jgi:hypothetical protein
MRFLSDILFFGETSVAETKGQESILVSSIEIQFFILGFFSLNPEQYLFSKSPAISKTLSNSLKNKCLIMIFRIYKQSRPLSAFKV